MQFIEEIALNPHIFYDKRKLRKGKFNEQKIESY